MAAVFLNALDTTLVADFGTGDTLLQLSTGVTASIAAALYGADWPGTALDMHGHFVPLVVQSSGGFELVYATGVVSGGGGTYVTRPFTKLAASTGDRVLCAPTLQHPTPRVVVLNDYPSRLSPGAEVHKYQDSSTLTMILPWRASLPQGAFIPDDTLPLRLVAFLATGVSTLHFYDLDSQEMTIYWRNGVAPSIPAGTKVAVFEFQFLQPRSLRTAARMAFGSFELFS